MLMQNVVHGGLRKIVCMFSEKKVWGMQIYFVEREKGDFVLELGISEWGKNKGQRMATESCRRFEEEKH